MREDSSTSKLGLCDSLWYDTKLTYKNTCLATCKYRLHALLHGWKGTWKCGNLNYEKREEGKE